MLLDPQSKIGVTVTSLARDDFDLVSFGRQGDSEIGQMLGDGDNVRKVNLTENENAKGYSVIFFQEDEWLTVEISE